MDRVTVAVDFERLENRVMQSTARRLHRALRAEMEGASRPTLYVRPRIGAIPRASSRRKHKRRNRKQFVFLRANVFSYGTTTGRISQSEPARYDIMASGRIVRTPRD